jgi:thioredoxin-dependent peroxiredoxin
MTHLKKGDLAPEISGNDQHGRPFSLSELKGKKVVLYFYPKDDTPGCTAEACDLRDHYADFLNKGFEVIGVSPDSEKSHQKFMQKYNLPFRLLADEDKLILQSFGVWGEKKMYGKPYMGVIRTTFIINEEGVIESILEKVDTKDHSNQIFKELSI